MKTNDDYISRRAAIDAAMSAKSCADTTFVNDDYIRGYRNGKAVFEKAVLNALVDISPADVQPVVIGQWVRPHYRNSVHCYNCSKCGAEAQHMEFRGVLKYYNKCPNCGAEMRGVDNG